MKRLGLPGLALLALAACGDPLRGIERVSEGAALPAEPGANALPTEEELAREDSILSGLFRAPPDDADRESAPVEDLARQELAVGNEAAATAVIDLETPNEDVDRSSAPRAGGTTGLLGWLRRAAQTENEPAEASILPRADTTEGASEQDAPVELAALGPNEVVEPEKRRGLFGSARRQRRDGPDAVDVVPGMVVPFGQIARNCDARPAHAGKVVDKAARKGRGYVLYDTAPDSTSPRTFYVTGFSDNCPRQFTAALALFGDPEFHEQLRYGLPADEYPYSTTDEAYEKLKRRVCNVGRNKPCGGRIDRLARNTTFISAYENFTDNGRWADMLLHDGAVLAAALKTP